MKTKGLSLSEAHNSGKFYRRPTWSAYKRFGATIETALEDVLATDYELEPQAKLLTQEDVRHAVLASLLPHECDGSSVTAFHRAAEICYKLFGEEDL